MRISTPKGQLSAGKRKVAGVVSQEVYSILVRFMEERGLPNMCQCTGEALRQWAGGRGWVQNLNGGDEGSR